MMDDSGDLLLSADGDIQLTDSVKQAIEIRLKWFANEWKLGPSLGISYYDDVFIKNPSEELIEEKMREAISDIEGVEEIQSFDINSNNGKIAIKYSVLVSDNAIEGRVSINV